MNTYKVFLPSWTEIIHADYHRTFHHETVHILQFWNNGEEEVHAEFNTKTIYGFVTLKKEDINVADDN